MRTLKPMVPALALLLAACTGGATEPTNPILTTAVDVAAPTELVNEWVPADLSSEGLLIGDTLTAVGARFVIFEEVDGNQVEVWTSEDGRSWSSGDNSAFPPRRPCSLGARQRIWGDCGRLVRTAFVAAPPGVSSGLRSSVDHHRWARMDRRAV